MALVPFEDALFVMCYRFELNVLIVGKCLPFCSSVIYLTYFYLLNIF